VAAGNPIGMPNLVRLLTSLVGLVDHQTEDQTATEAAETDIFEALSARVAESNLTMSGCWSGDSNHGAFLALQARVFSGSENDKVLDPLTRKAGCEAEGALTM